jgi:ribosomal protein S18 acetylase RimI-like enzyme
MIRIITATASEAELIADISRETFYHTFAEFNTKEDMDKFLWEQFSKKKLIAEVTEKGSIFLLAYVDDQLAGYVFMKDNTHEDLGNKNAIEISRLYARSSFIGKGIGKALMNAAIEQAQQLQKNYIWLGVWEHNHRAIDFYKKYSFEKFSEHDFTLGNDIQRDWVMKKEIINS